MIKKSVFLPILAACLLVTGNASAYEFWGGSVGTAELAGAVSSRSARRGISRKS